MAEMEILEALRDLHKQATTERSHYYVGRTCERACAEIEQLRAGLVMRAFGASDAACYKWPDDTPEHKALRAAYIEGAAACAVR